MGPQPHRWMADKILNPFAATAACPTLEHVNLRPAASRAQGSRTQPLLQVEVVSRLRRRDSVLLRHHHSYASRDARDFHYRFSHENSECACSYVGVLLTLCGQFVNVTLGRIRLEADNGPLEMCCEKPREIRTVLDVAKLKRIGLPPHEFAFDAGSYTQDSGRAPARLMSEERPARTREFVHECCSVHVFLKINPMVN